MNKKLTVTGANIVFLIIMGICLLFSLIVGVIEAFYPGFTNRRFFETSLIIQYVIILIPVLVYTLIKGINIKEAFRFNKLDAVPAVIIAVISIPALFAASMLNTAVLYVLQFIGNIPPEPIPVPKDMRELMIGIFVIAVSPAFCEEMLNRGLILRAYEKRGSLKAVVISAVFFGFFHFDLTNLLGPIFLGLLIGYYVMRTNSIFAGMLAHFLNNAFSEVYSFLWERNEAVVNRITISAAEMASVAFWGIAGLIAVALLLSLFRYVTKGGYRLVPAISNVKKDILSILSHWPVIIVLALYLLVSALYLLSIALAKT